MIKYTAKYEYPKLVYMQCWKKKFQVIPEASDIPIEQMRVYYLTQPCLTD